MPRSESLARGSSRLIFLIVAALLGGASGALASPPPAQDARSAPPPRPRIVLVLGGDGAYGLANVGVLQALEELRIPVDAIAGSGTGALVGGLYAVGNTPERLRKALTGIDWDEALLDRTPRDHLAYRRKVDDREFLVDLSVGLGRGGFTLPRSVFAAKRWTLFVETLALPAIGASTFDDLPIPFRAIATDLETGGAVVLAHGDLASSLRASSAIPGLFPPVEIEGRLLTDGVLSNALPVELAPELAPGPGGIAIAVELEVPLAKGEAIRSYIDVGEQILRLREANQRKQIAPALRPDDVHVVLSLKERSLLSHASALAIAQEGHDAILEQQARLARFALDPAAWDEHLRARKAREKPWPVLGGVRIAASAPVAPEIVRDRIESPVGEPIEPESLHRDFARVFGLDLYDDVGFHLEEEKDGSSQLVVDTRPKNIGPWTLRFGASSQADLTGGNGITLGALAVRRPVNDLGAEWRNRAQFGEHSLVETEFIQPLGYASPFFLAPSIGYDLQHIAVTQADESLAQYQVRTLAESLDLGYVLGDWGEVRTGFFHESGRNSREIGDPVAFPDSDFDQGGAEGSIAYDTLDSTGFPRRGSIGKSEFQATLDALGGEDNTQLLTVKHDTALSAGANTLVLGGEFDTTLKNGETVENQFPLGGFLRLSGLAPNEIAGSHALVARALGYHHFGFRDGMRAPVSFYLGGSLETGNVFNERRDIELANLRMAGSVFAGCDSFLGPMFLGVGVAEGGETNVFIILGSIF